MQTPENIVAHLLTEVEHLEQIPCRVRFELQDCVAPYRQAGPGKTRELAEDLDTFMGWLACSSEASDVKDSLMPLVTEAHEALMADVVRRERFTQISQPSPNGFRLFRNPVML